MHVSRWTQIHCVYTICDKIAEIKMFTALKYLLIQIRIYLWIKLALRNNSVWNIIILIKRLCLWLWLRMFDNLLYNQFEAVWSLSTISTSLCGMKSRVCFFEQILLIMDSNSNWNISQNFVKLYGYSSQTINYYFE